MHADKKRWVVSWHCHWPAEKKTIKKRIQPSEWLKMTVYAHSTQSAFTTIVDSSLTSQVQPRGSQNLLSLCCIFSGSIKLRFTSLCIHFKQAEQSLWNIFPRLLISLISLLYDTWLMCQTAARISNQSMLEKSKLKPKSSIFGEGHQENFFMDL